MLEPGTAVDLHDKDRPFPNFAKGEWKIDKRHNFNGKEGYLLINNKGHRIWAPEDKVKEKVKEFAPDPRGDSGTGLVMPTDKHELQELTLHRVIKLVEYQRFGINNILANHTRMGEKLIASNNSNWNWEYDADYIDAGLYLANDTGLRLEIVQTHIKSGLGAGTRSAIIEDAPVGTLGKPNLSAIRSMLAKHGHERTRSGAPFKSTWVTSDGNRKSLSEILKEYPKPGLQK